MRTTAGAQVHPHVSWFPRSGLPRQLLAQPSMVLRPHLSQWPYVIFEAQEEEANGDDGDGGNLSENEQLEGPRRDGGRRPRLSVHPLLLATMPSLGEDTCLRLKRELGAMPLGKGHCS